MKNTKSKKDNKKIKEQKSLSVLNYGDTVVIKNRLPLAGIISGGVTLLLCIAGAVALKEAWELPMFWAVFLTLTVSVLYSFANMIFGKIVLDSPNLQMTVYNPFKKQYKFEEINYVDIKSSKEKNGVITHKVIVYIEEGKRTVEMTTLSKKQADELASLLRGMLDNGAMTYPEGDEEPFNLDDEEDKKRGVVSFGLKKKRTEKNEDNKPAAQKPNTSDAKAEKNKDTSVSEDKKTGEASRMNSEVEKTDDAAASAASEG